MNQLFERSGASEMQLLVRRVSGGGYRAQKNPKSTPKVTKKIIKNESFLFRNRMHYHKKTVHPNWMATSLGARGAPSGRSQSKLRGGLSHCCAEIPAGISAGIAQPLGRLQKNIFCSAPQCRTPKARWRFGPQALWIYIYIYCVM